MSVRRAHGKGADALVRVETPPADELASGAQAVPSGPVGRRCRGRFTTDSAPAAGRLGGKASARRRKVAADLAEQLGMATVPATLAPYVGHAQEFASAQLAIMAQLYGDVGPGPASMVHSAALALAASRAAYAAEDAKTGARLADQSRQLLLTATHMADLEAKARPRENHFDAIRRNILEGGAS